MAIEFQCCKMRTFWRLDIVILLNYILKVVQIVNFMFCVFTHNFIDKQIDLDRDLKEGEVNFVVSHEGLHFENNNNI